MFKHLIRRYLSLALILALVLAASFGSSDQAAAAGETDLGRAIAAQEKHTDALMAIDGVIGTAVGRGNGGGHVVLALTTAAGVSGIPNSVDGVVVRPYVTGEIKAQPKPGSGGVDRTARFDRPVPIGVSTGHPDITAGTIGARVIGGDGTLYALSNNHVYADQNAATIGDAVIQPGTIDGGSSPADDIGTLADFEPIKFDGSDNVIDAAIASTNVSLLSNATPSDGYGVPSSTLAVAAIGQDVTKYGRTTGKTDGKVDAINATVNVGYDGGTARFVGQVIIKGRKGSFSAGGDSGSLIVVKDSKNPVALLFAGNSTITVGNPIAAVMSRFGITIDDGSGPPPPPPATGSIAGTVLADDGTPIGGAGVSTDSGQSGTADSNGAYSIADVPTGDRTVTASAAGFAGSSKSAAVTEDQTTTVDFTLTEIQVGTATVASISYSASGGKSGDKDLRITIKVIDAGSGAPIEGASVSIDLYRDGTRIGSGTASTGSDGTITFRLRNAKSGAYTTVVTDVTAADYVWDGNFPENSYDK